MDWTRIALLAGFSVFAIGLAVLAAYTEAREQKQRLPVNNEPRN
jgi:hypothetical protein